MTRYILLIYSDNYLLTWYICKSKKELFTEYRYNISQDNARCSFNFSYKWIALKLTTKN